MLTVQKAEPILLTLLHIQRAYNKDYSYPSQDTIGDNMGKYRRVKKCRATLNRWLRVLEDEGYIKRVRRIKRDPRLGMVFKSTMYFISLKAFKFLRTLGWNVSKELSALLAKLRFKYPEFAAKSTKKKLDSAKRNTQHGEFMRGIEEKLVKLPVIE